LAFFNKFQFLEDDFKAFSIYKNGVLYIKRSLKLNIYLKKHSVFI